MVLGWFFVRPIPLPAPSGADTLGNGPTSSHWRSYLERGDGSGTRLLPDNELDYEENYVRPTRKHTRAVSIASCGEVVATAHSGDEQPDISGKELLINPDFWLLFTIMSLCESPIASQGKLVLTLSSERRRFDV